MTERTEHRRRSPIGSRSATSNPFLRLLGGVTDQGKTALRSAVFEVLARLGPFAAATRDGPTYLVSTSDRIIAKELFRRGHFDLPDMVTTVELIAGLLGEPDPLKDKVFVDVGANVGSTALAALQVFGASRVVALEPSPQNLRLLRCNVILNGVEDRVTCLPCAASSKVSGLVLELSADNSGDNRIRTRRQEGALGEQDWETVEVLAAPLSDLLANAGVDAQDIGLVWVDTQGHEAEVLSGCGAELSGVPKLIEYWPYGLRRAGGLEALHDQIRSYRTVLDVRASVRARRPLLVPEDKIDSLPLYYTGQDHTDLLLIP